MVKIHVVEGMKLSEEQKRRLDSLGEVKYFDGIPDGPELLKRVKGADVVAADWSPIDSEIPKMPQGIKLIAVPFTGVGFLPLKEAAAKGIKIANAPGYATESVGEFGVGLMIAVVRGLHAYAKDEPKPSVTPSLCGRTIGILGAGRIGTYVGKVAKKLGMKVIYWKRGKRLSSVLKRSDVVYCALPLSEETKGLLGEKEFGMMKSGSYFVTTSHIQIYNHEALLNALNNNLAGAAVDLEGTAEGDYGSDVYMKLKSNPKVLVTPHVAYKTDYAIRRGYDIMIDNIKAFVEGKPINIVN